MNRRAWFGLAGGWTLLGPQRLEGRPSNDFEALFDGESLAGWTAIDGAPGAWRVESGCLTAPTGKNWLSTNQAFSNFDLRLDYRLERGGNSGVLLRAPHAGDPSYEGLEVQILDDAARRYQDLKPDQYTGSVYGVIAARRGFTRPIGTWNRLAIQLTGASIRVSLNGTCVVDARLDGQPATVVQRHPGLARARGFIGLQAHDAPVWSRKIAIKSLS